MNAEPMATAAIVQTSSAELGLSGAWTVRGVDTIEQQIDSLSVPYGTGTVADGSHIEALDTAGAWVLQTLLQRLRKDGAIVTLRGLRPEFTRLLDSVAQSIADQSGRAAIKPETPQGTLERIGRAGDHRRTWAGLAATPEGPHEAIRVSVI